MVPKVIAEGDAGNPVVGVDVGIDHVISWEVQGNGAPDVQVLVDIDTGTIAAGLSNSSETAGIDGLLGFGVDSAGDSEGGPSVVQDSDPENVVASGHVNFHAVAVALDTSSDLEDVQGVPKSG